MHDGATFCTRPFDLFLLFFSLQECVGMEPRKLKAGCVYPPSKTFRNHPPKEGTSGPVKQHRKSQLRSRSTRPYSHHQSQVKHARRIDSTTRSAEGIFVHPCMAIGASSQPAFGQAGDLESLRRHLVSKRDPGLVPSWIFLQGLEISRKNPVNFSSLLHRSWG